MTEPRREADEAGGRELDGLAEPLTLDDVRAMSLDEAKRRWPEVKAVLAGRPSGAPAYDIDWATVDLATLPPDVVEFEWHRVVAEQARRARVKVERARRVAEEAGVRLEG